MADYRTPEQIAQAAAFAALTAEIKANLSANPSETIRQQWCPPPDFDPDNPESMFWNLGRKLNRQKKLDFLKVLSKTGRIKLASQSIGVTYQTVAKHREMDPVFDALCEESLDRYNQSTLNVLETQAVEGVPEARFDKDGNLLSFRRVVNNRLQEMVMKRLDSSYVEVQKSEVKVEGGALVVPAPIDDPSNWDMVVARMLSGSSEAPKGLPMPAAFPTVGVDAETGMATVGETADPDAIDAEDNLSMIVRNDGSESKLM